MVKNPSDSLLARQKNHQINKWICLKDMCQKTKYKISGWLYSYNQLKSKKNKGCVTLVCKE